MADTSGAVTGKSSFSIGTKRVAWVSLIGDYFAIPAVLVAVVFALFKLGGTAIDNSPMWDTVIDALLVSGALFFLLASIYSYVKSKNMRIESAMFGFSMASLAFFIASSLWAWNSLASGGNAHFPSMADAFSLVGLLAIISAIYSATRAISETTGLKLMLNEIAMVLLAVIATAAIVGTYASFTNILRDGLTPVALTSILYTALDSIALAMAMNLIISSRGRSVVEPQTAIAVAALVLMASHIYYSITASMGFLRYGSLAITLYAIAYMLYAMGIMKYVNLTRSDIVKDHLSKHARAK